MKISTRIRYGTRALLELAKAGETLSISTLAERQSLSVKYLEQIMRALRKAGIVESTAGMRGGYRLSRPPSGIRLDEVYLAFEGTFALVDCVETPSYCQQADRCPTLKVWAGLSDTLHEAMRAITLADLLGSSGRE